MTIAGGRGPTHLENDPGLARNQGSRTTSRRHESPDHQTGSTKPQSITTAQPSQKLQTALGNHTMHGMLAGHTLPANVRDLMQRQFGYEFSDVRIHTEEAAARTAAALSAKAVTVGPDIYFARGRWQPDGADGRALIAHELAHVIQQSRGTGPPSADRSSAGERDAHAAAQAVRAGVGPIAVTAATGTGVAREEDDPPQSTPVDPEAMARLKELLAAAAQKPKPKQWQAPSGDTEVDARFSEWTQLDPDTPTPPPHDRRSGAVEKAEPIGDDGAIRAQAPSTPETASADRRKMLNAVIGIRGFENSIGVGGYDEALATLEEKRAQLAADPDHVRLAGLESRRKKLARRKTAQAKIDLAQVDAQIAELKTTATLKAQVGSLERKLARSGLTAPGNPTAKSPGAPSGVGNNTFVVMQVLDADGKVLASAAAPNGGPREGWSRATDDPKLEHNHAEENAMPILKAQLAAAGIETVPGGRVVVVGDQVVCAKICIPAVSKFAIDLGVDAADGYTFSSKSAKGRYRGPKTTARLATVAPPAEYEAAHGGPLVPKPLVEEHTSIWAAPKTGPTAPSPAAPPTPSGGGHDTPDHHTQPTVPKSSHADTAASAQPSTISTRTDSAASSASTSGPGHDILELARPKATTSQAVTSTALPSPPIKPTPSVAHPPSMPKPSAQTIAQQASHAPKVAPLTTPAPSHTTAANTQTAPAPAGKPALSVNQLPRTSVPPPKVTAPVSHPPEVAIAMPIPAIKPAPVTPPPQPTRSASVATKPTTTAAPAATGPLIQPGNAASLAGPAKNAPAAASAVLGKANLVLSAVLEAKNRHKELVESGRGNAAAWIEATGRAALTAGASVKGGAIGALVTAGNSYERAHNAGHDPYDAVATAVGTVGGDVASRKLVKPSVAGLAVEGVNTAAQLVGAPEEVQLATAGAAEFVPSQIVSRTITEGARSLGAIVKAVQGDTRGVDHLVADWKTGAGGPWLQGYTAAIDIAIDTGTGNRTFEQAVNKAAEPGKGSWADKTGSAIGGGFSDLGQNEKALRGDYTPIVQGWAQISRMGSELVVGKSWEQALDATARASKGPKGSKGSIEKAGDTMGDAAYAGHQQIKKLTTHDLPRAKKFVAAKAAEIRTTAAALQNKAVEQAQQAKGAVVEAVGRLVDDVAVLEAHARQKAGTVARTAANAYGDAKRRLAGLLTW